MSGKTNTNKSYNIVVSKIKLRHLNYIEYPVSCKYSTGSRLFFFFFFLRSDRAVAWVILECATPLLSRNGTFRTASPRPLLPEQHGSRERFSQPAIAVHRPSDAYSSQLFIQRLATRRPSEAALFSPLFSGATFPP